MRNWFNKGRLPAVQPATGLLQDRDFDPDSASFGQTLRAWVRGKVYEMDEADAKRLRPTWTRDPRAVRNEQLKRERLERQRRGSMIISVEGDDDEYEPAIPRAEILPPAPRGGTPVPGDDPGDSIRMP